MSFVTPTLMLLDPDPVRRSHRATLLETAGFALLNSNDLASDDPSTQKPDLILRVDDPSTRGEHATDLAIDPTTSATEFLCTVRRQLRALQPEPAPIALRNGTLDLARQTFATVNEERALTPLQVDTLHFLVARLGRAVTRDELMRRIWGTSHQESSRAIDQLINRLRFVIEVNKSEPDHLLSVRGVGYRFVLAPKTSSTQEPETSSTHNLPTYPDSFVGRTQVLNDHVQAWDSSSRLWSLLGPGGIGKTRLAIELGHRWRTEKAPQGGAWFVDLSEAHSLSDILHCLAQSIHLKLGASLNSQELLEHLHVALRFRGHAALILDNCEQVMEPVRQLVTHLRSQCPELRILVTSRERLRLRGEHSISLDTLKMDDSSSLFLERAGWTDKALSGVQQRSLIAICDTLDGVPLALELAAARAEFLGLIELEKRLVKPFQVLKSRNSGLPLRQRTLLAALQWSWDLLRPSEQQVLAQCSCFRGGFTLEAVEAVVELAASKDEAIDFILESLIDKSLIQEFSTPAASGTHRFTMLKSTQVFAASQLSGSPTQETTTFARHGDYFAQFGRAEFMNALFSHKGVQQRKRLEEERENLSSAVTRAHAVQATIRAVNCCLAWIQSLKFTRPSAAMPLAQRLLEYEFDTSLRLRLLQAVGATERTLNLFDDAKRHFEEGLQLARAAGNGKTEGRFIGSLGTLHQLQGDGQKAEHLYEQAIQLAQAHDDALHEGLWINNLAGLLYINGQTEQALVHIDKALGIHRRMGNIWAEAHILTNLAVTQINQGAIEQAHQSIQQAIVLAHKMGDRDGLVSMFSNQANIALQLGHIQRGIQCCQNALVINKEIGDIRLEANTLHTLANAYYLQGRPHRGLKTLERTLALYKQINDPIGQASTLFSIGTVRLGWDEEDAAWALFEQTRSIVKERPNPTINSLCAAAMARIHARRGDSEQARTCLHQALALQPLLGKSDSAHLICQQGHVELLLNHPQGAQEAIDRVCALIEPEQRTPSSQVGNVLTALQRALEVNTTKGQTIPAPEGTVAVVFTHIPDTNTLWTALDDDFLSILKQHDEFILRNAHRHNGYVVKNSGDSFMLVFAETHHALAFARSTQRELLNSYWASDFSDAADKTMRFSIRMGLHTGPTERRANPLDGRFDYFGPAVNLASRITQLGQNNDILATATFVEDSNDEPTRWSALGPQRIKGFAHPFDLLKTSFVRAPSDASRG